MAPLILGGILALSAVSLFIMGWIRGDCDGVRAEITVRSQCATEWSEIIEARGDSVGLCSPEVSVEAGVVRYVSTLPGNSDDKTAMPKLLTQSGMLEVFLANAHGTGIQGEPLATSTDIVSVSLSLDSRGHPFVDIKFQPHAAKRLQGEKYEARKMLYFLDGEKVDEWPGRTPFEGATIRLQPRENSKKISMRRAVDWNIVLRNGPAPCAVDDVQLKVMD